MLIMFLFVFLLPTHFNRIFYDHAAHLHFASSQIFKKTFIRLRKVGLTLTPEFDIILFESFGPTSMSY